MSRFFHSRYASLEAYTPGEQPRDKQYIKLNTNESPFPPSEGVLRALGESEMADLRLYSDPTAKKLREALALRYDLAPENVYAAGGSDDVLNFAFMSFGEGGVAYPAISYGFYSVFAALHGIAAEEIPLRDDFSIDIADYYDKHKLIVIANPNAPTGLCLSLCEIEDILSRNRDCVVVIDEAYIDFGGESAYTLIPKYDNLLVVQTFSKSRSMAGLRLGYALGNTDLITDLEKLKYSTNPYNLGRLTQLCGTAALAEDDYYMNHCKTIIENREYTKRELRALGFTVTESMANFVFAKSPDIAGEALYLALKQRGILVRHFTREEIADYNRITIGSMDEMQSFIKTVKEILGK